MYFVLIYLLLSLILYLNAHFTLICLKHVRLSVQGKSRQKFDQIIKIITDIKKWSFVLPYSIILITRTKKYV